ncbi:MAG: 1-acyl-sn-glycerol-3-phosphate acyltransferase [Saprospiraceae bacterium]|nr:1-acyl-sn-glycerol-3-phosphate acyltransferase [Saprospiraceae bacterium]
MGKPFIWIYNFFRKHPVLFYVVLVLITIYAVLGISRLKWNNDIFSIFPQKTSSAQYKEQVNNLRSNNNIMVLLHTEHATDTSLQVLLANAEWWEYRLKSSPYFRTNIQDGRIRMTDSLQRVLYDSVFYNLPLLLDGGDLITLGHRLELETMEKTLAANNRISNSLAGYSLRYYNNLDPLHLAPLVLSKLATFRTVPSLKQVNGFQVSKDERNLLFDFTAVFKDNEDVRYGALLDSLNEMQLKGEQMFPGVKTFLIGAPIASEINKDRSFKDGNLTGLLSVLLTLGLLYYFYRRKRLALIVLVPSVFGYSFALATFGWMGVPIVAMAMSSATIILAMGINYSIHLVNARIHCESITEAIEEISHPLIVGNVTTIAAFALLMLSDSLLLQQFGYLAVLSLAAGVLTTLVVLPQWLDKEKTREREVSLPWFEKFTSYAFHKNKWIIGILAVGSLLMIIPASKIQFQGDLSKLNYIPPRDQAGFDIIENDLGFDLSRTMLQVKAPQLDSALAIYSEARQQLLLQDSAALIPDLTAIQPTTSMQYANHERWVQFWSDSLIKSNEIKAENIHGGSAMTGFLKKVKSLDTLAVPERFTNEFKNVILNRMVHNDTRHNVIIHAPVIGKFDLENHEHDAKYQLFNRQHFANQTAGLVQKDFNNILTYSGIIVFFLLLLVYGRLELALLAFLPMTISWFWILGIAHLTGIQIHIVNLILCTFIFGLCDDYSIFMIDGLTKEYSTGRKVIDKDKKVIVISVLVTMIGLAAMLAGKHPAFHSFAALALIGLGVVLVLSLTLQPALYHYFVTYRTERGNAPVTLLSFYVSIVTFSTFILLGVLLSILGLILKWTGLMRLSVIRYIFHVLIQWACYFVMWITPTGKYVREGMENIDWDKPGIIVSNHQTHIDLLMMLSLYPKIVVLTNQWVYNNIIYGGLVRSAGYLPGFAGTDKLAEMARKQIEAGYFILIFPEGTRSEDGEIKRFHKGAFLLADQLNVPIYPVLLHGMNIGLSKGDQNLKTWSATLRALPPVLPEDPTYGEDYSSRGKAINRMMRNRFEALKAEREDPNYHFDTLRKNYLYKGPILYWYAKIKMMNENLYSVLNQLIPRKANILDLGCGYGMMDYMLAMCSNERMVTGVDYDEEKIEVAVSNFSAKRVHIDFHHADINTYKIMPHDVFILYDSLHYLKKEEQKALLEKCAHHLNPGGMILIREGIASAGIAKHNNTRMTEWFSTTILGFNKTYHELAFIEEEMIAELARHYDLSLEKKEDSSFSSNTLFILRNNQKQ